MCDTSAKMSDLRRRALRPLPLLVCLLLAFAPHLASAKAKPNDEFDGEAPARTPLAADAPEVRDALRFVMTELKRLSNRYRYATLTQVHGATAGAANFGGRNLFLDLELDMLKNQRSRHDFIVFKDEGGVITGMAIDEFPETKLRDPHPDPDV